MFTPSSEDTQMIAVVAAGAFLGLFALWVVLPKKLMRK